MADASLGRRAVRLAAMTSVAVLVASCQQLYELEELNRAPPATQAEAGSTHVFGVAYPWRTFADALQPTFPMTPELALASSLPTTAGFSSRTVEAFRAQIAAGLPRTTVTESQTRATDAAGVETVTESQARNREPGQAPALPGALATIPGAVSLPLAQAALAHEPFLRYSAASDLFQEVQILNKALRELYVGSGVVPYLVRLKVSPLAYRRQLRFDIYSDIVFFEARTELNNEPSNTVQVATRSTSRVPAKVVQCPWEAGVPQSGPKEATARVKQLPYVVPLLVTDDLEVASEAVTAQAILELAAALSGTVGNAGVGGQAQAVRDSLNAALANSSNALRTVVRLGDNAIRVRLGAAYAAGPFGTKAYEHTTRTHNVSLLLLVPKAQLEAVPDDQDARIEFVARTSLRNVKDGSLLTVRDPDQAWEDLRLIAEGVKLPRRVGQRRKCGTGHCIRKFTDADVTDEHRSHAYDMIGDLRGFALYGEVDNFNTLLESCTAGFDDERDLRDLWAELTSFSGSYNVASSTIRLPKPPPRCLPSMHQLVLLRDDKKQTVAQIAGVSGYEAREISARLLVGSAGGGPELPASAVAATDGLLTLGFPSLNALGLAKEPKDATAVELGGQLQVIGPATDAECNPNVRAPSYYRQLRYAVAEPTKATAWKTTAVPATSVIADRGSGQVGVGLEFEPGNPTKPALISVAGAEVTSASSGQLDALGRVRVEKPGFLTLSLRNMAPGGKVVITGAFPADGGKVTDVREIGTVAVVAAERRDEAEAAKSAK